MSQEPLTIQSNYANIQAIMPTPAAPEMPLTPRMTPEELLQAAANLNGDVVRATYTEAELFGPSPEAEFAERALVRRLLDTARNSHKEEKLPAGSMTNPYVAIQKVSEREGAPVVVDGYYFKDATYTVTATTDQEVLRDIRQNTLAHLTNHNPAAARVEIRVPRPEPVLHR